MERVDERCEGNDRQRMINKEAEEEGDENQSFGFGDLIESQVTRGDTLESIWGNEEPDGISLLQQPIH